MAQKEQSLIGTYFWSFLQFQNLFVFIFPAGTRIVTQHFWHASVGNKVVGVAVFYN